MNNFLYYFIILPLSFLNTNILYLVSNFLAFVLSKLLKYRYQIITKNLSKSFPDKTKGELHKLRNSFYHHFSDLIIESLKGFTISENQIKKKISIKNKEMLNDFALKGQNVILIGGHFNNWEMSAQKLPLECKHELFAIYKPLSNKFFDKKMKSSRGKFGLKMIPMKETKNYFKTSNTKPRAIIFGSDQRPSNPKNAHWINFLNQDTGFLFGAEKYAKEFNWPVLYVSIQKLKRGRYDVNFELITSNPSIEPSGKIIESFASFLERDIINSPQFWLWTHNRWKINRN